MTDDDVSLTARFAAYERVLEYLLCHHLARQDSATWPEVQAAIIGPGATLTGGIIDVIDLERIETEIAARIDGVFERAANWAARAQVAQSQ